MNTETQPRSEPADIAASVVARLRRKEPVTALGVRSARTAEIARLAKASGHDVIWVDLEHSSISIEVASQICSAAIDIGLTPLVRVPEREYGAIGRLLDGGAMGIIAPRIDTAAQAADVVAACRFPPLGHRSAIAQLPAVRYQRLPAAALNEISNRGTIVKVLIETQLGLDNLHQIASLPGIDIIGVGTNDLSAELGVPGQTSHPLVREAHAHALRVCAALGKPLAIGGVSDAAYNLEILRLGGAPFLMTGIDTEMMLSAAHERVRNALQSIANNS